MNRRFIENLVEKNRNRLTFISGQHPTVQQIKHIRCNNGAESGRMALAEGIGVHQKLLSTNLRISKFLFCPEMIYTMEAVRMLETCMERANETFVLSRRLFERLADRDEPEGFLSLVELPCHDRALISFTNRSLVIVLDGLETPGNIGTILRTCDGAGVDAVILCNRKVRITNPKLVKGSMGAVFSVPVLEFENTRTCMQWLREMEFTIYLADTRADKTYRNFDYAGNTALVMGSERFGISDEWYSCNHQLLSIPMRGICDSLNVGVAASIIVYEASLKRGS